MSKNTSKAAEIPLPLPPSAENSSVRPLLWGGVTGVVVALTIYLVALYAGGVLLSAYATLRHWSTAYANTWLNTSIAAQFFYV